MKQKTLEKSEKRVLIIDQLYESGTQENFTKTCKELLANNGYKIKTVKGENVTLGTLTALNWKKSLIILRMHSGIFDNSTWLFTGQEYSNTRYVIEQLSGEINIGRCPTYDHPVFTFSNQFIRRNFEFSEDSILILMGCSGMEIMDVSSSFHEKGCKTVIGWSGPITKTQTDKASLLVLNLLLKGESIAKIVENQNQKLDTSFGESKMVFSET